MIPARDDQAMRLVPVARVVAGGLARRWAQTILIGLVLAISSAASVLAAALLVDSRSAGTRFCPTVKAAGTARIAADVPFVVSLSAVGLLVSLLIVVTVISGTVTAGHARIGILKTIGFTPGQVTTVYAGQGLVPAAAGCLGGVVLASVLAGPLLGSAGYFFGVLGVPAWIDVDVAVAVCGLAAIAALVPAMRAARLSGAAALRTG